MGPRGCTDCDIHELQWTTGSTLRGWALDGEERGGRGSERASSPESFDH